MTSALGYMVFLLTFGLFELLDQEVNGVVGFVHDQLLHHAFEELVYFVLLDGVFQLLLELQFLLFKHHL